MLCGLMTTIRIYSDCFRLWLQSFNRNSGLLKGQFLMLLNKSDLGLRVGGLMIQMSEISPVYCCFSYCGKQWQLIKHFPPEYSHGPYYNSVSHAGGYAHVPRIAHWDIGGNTMLLSTRSFTHTLFFLLPIGCLIS